MKPKVLMVDDDPLMQILYKKHLEEGGYEMLAAKDGSEAVITIERDAPQLIIMDIMMPGLDGLSVLRKLKKSEVTRNIPVIVTTANVGAMAATRRECENSGAAGFLPKPFSPGQLLEEVRRLAPVEPPQNTAS